MFRGFLSTWVGLLINGVVGILLVPLLVHGLGPVYFAIWTLVSSVLDYYGLLDMGMRYSLQRFVARYGGANERQALNESFMTGLSMGGIIAAAVVVICGILVVFLPGFFHLTGQARTIFRIVLAIQSVTIAFNLPARIMGAYLCGLHRFDLYNGSAVVQGVLKGIIFWIVIRMGGGVISIAVSYMLIMALTLALVFTFVRHADPKLSIGRKNTSWARTKEMFSFSFFVFVSDIGDRLRFYTDNIVISHVLTVALVTPFSVVGKLMETFKTAFFPITGPLNTEANRLEGQKNFDAVKSLFLRSTKVCALLAFACTTVLVVHGRSILRFWMMKDPTFLSNYGTSSYGILLALVAGYCVILMQSPSNVFLYVRSRQKTLAWWTLVEGLVNLGLSIYWAHKYGIIGVAWGTTVPMLVVRLLIQPFYTLRVMEISWLEYLSKAFLRPAIVTAAVLGVAAVTGLSQTPVNRMSFAGTMLAYAVLFLTFSYWLVFDREERASLRQRGARIIERVRVQHA